MKSNLLLFKNANKIDNEKSKENNGSKNNFDLNFDEDRKKLCTLIIWVLSQMGHNLIKWQRKGKKEKIQISKYKY